MKIVYWRDLIWQVILLMKPLLLNVIGLIEINLPKMILNLNLQRISHICTREFDVCSSMQRPDIAFALGVLRRYQPNHHLQCWVAAKKVLRYLQRTNFLCLGIQNNAREVVGYTELILEDVRMIWNQLQVFLLFMLARETISWKDVT